MAYGNPEMGVGIRPLTRGHTREKGGRMSAPSPNPEPSAATPRAPPRRLPPPRAVVSVRCLWPSSPCSRADGEVRRNSWGQNADSNQVGRISGPGGDVARRRLRERPDSGAAILAACCNEDKRKRRCKRRTPNPPWQRARLPPAQAQRRPPQERTELPGRPNVVIGAHRGLRGRRWSSDTPAHNACETRVVRDFLI
jgi:hypothetical protein